MTKFHLTPEFKSDLNNYYIKALIYPTNIESLIQVNLFYTKHKHKDIDAIINRLQACEKILKLLIQQGLDFAQDPETSKLLVLIHTMILDDLDIVTDKENLFELRLKDEFDKVIDPIIERTLSLNRLLKSLTQVS